MPAMSASKRLGPAPSRLLRQPAASVSVTMPSTASWPSWEPPTRRTPARAEIAVPTIAKFLDLGRLTRLSMLARFRLQGARKNVAALGQLLDLRG